MNLRIEELVKRANLTEIIDDCYQERGDWQPFVEKFAQLIIRDCLERIPDDCQSLNGCHLSWTLKDHFGIDQ